MKYPTIITECQWTTIHVSCYTRLLANKMRHSQVLFWNPKIPISQISQNSTWLCLILFANKRLFSLPWVIVFSLSQNEVEVEVVVVMVSGSDLAWKVISGYILHVINQRPVVMVGGQDHRGRTTRK